MTHPDMQTEAHAAYAAWVAQQGDPDPAGWAELPADEQEAWRRAVRLIAVLGWEEFP